MKEERIKIEERERNEESILESMTQLKNQEMCTNEIE